MKHIDEIKDYWNQRANGFSLAIEEELESASGADWRKFFQKNICEGAEVLDDGTGPGFFPALLTPMGYRVTAIDYSEEMVLKARERLSAMNINAHVLQMDAQNLQFADESFDAVVSRNVLWNLDDPAKAYCEIHRVLRPKGKVIIDDGNMYLYLHNAAYAAAHERAMEDMRRRAAKPTDLHNKHNVDNVDFSIIEKIAEDLPMSRTLRPQWDFEQLLHLGFDDIHICIRGRDLPMGFRIVARKKA